MNGMRFSLCLSVLFCAVLSVYGSGYQLYSESSADVLGVGGAGVARSGYASSAWYNPAATTTVDRPTITGGGSFILLESHYTSRLGRDDMQDKTRLTGFFYAVQPVNPDARLTLSVNVPYGMVTQWDSDTQLAEQATYTSIRACYISPGVAYKVTDELSVAAGFNAVIGVARMANYIDLSKAGMPRNKLFMAAEGYGFGGFASVFWKPLDDWSFGAHYQSQVKLKLDGEKDARFRYYNRTSFGALNFIKGDVDTTLRLPAYLALGVENSTFKDWRFMFDAVWTQWSLYDSMDINFEHYPSSGVRGTSRNVRDWKDVWSYRVGVEYQLTDKWVLRTGCMYDVSPANDRTRSPEMPESDKTLLALGCGYQDSNWGVDLTYAYVFFKDAKLGTNVAKKQGLGDNIGEFETRCQVLSVQLTLRF